MLRYLPFIIELGLLIFCLIDCIQTDSLLVRNLAKPYWVLIIIVLPIVGPIAWLVAGRPERQQRARSVPWPSTQTAGFPEYERPRPPRGPDDDPAFLATAGGVDPEKEELLRRWEASLREREQAAPQPADAVGSVAGEQASDGAAGEANDETDGDSATRRAS